ncbi:nucleotidyltransferase family protein [bacterium]|nr:nucleotidyltransferase family protein [bacterium]
MEIQKDFKELLELLNKHNVDYVIIGGYALAFYGAPRYTGDIDVLVKADQENAKRVLEAIKEFGFECVNLTKKDFSVLGQVIQLGMPPVRIDIVTSISGVSWDQIYKNKIAGDYGDVPVFFISREDFIVNKRAVGRHKDLADIEALDGNED